MYKVNQLHHSDSIYIITTLQVICYNNDSFKVYYKYIFFTLWLLQYTMTIQKLNPSSHLQYLLLVSLTSLCMGAKRGLL